jgi:hypothetical protein
LNYRYFEEAGFAAIHDRCEGCEKIHPVTKVGYISDLMVRERGRYVTCYGSGLLAATVVHLLRLTSEEI